MVSIHTFAAPRTYHQFQTGNPFFNFLKTIRSTEIFVLISHEMYTYESKILFDGRVVWVRSNYNHDVRPL
jgi:hypothetical protein